MHCATGLAWSHHAPRSADTSTWVFRGCTAYLLPSESANVFRGRLFLPEGSGEGKRGPERRTIGAQASSGRVDRPTQALVDRGPRPTSGCGGGVGSEGARGGNGRLDCLRLPSEEEADEPLPRPNRISRRCRSWCWQAVSSPIRCCTSLTTQLPPVPLTCTQPDSEVMAEPASALASARRASFVYPRYRGSATAERMPTIR